MFWGTSHSIICAPKIEGWRGSVYWWRYRETSQAGCFTTPVLSFTLSIREKGLCSVIPGNHHVNKPMVSYSYLDAKFRLRYQHAQLLMNHYRLGGPYKTTLERLSHIYSISLNDTVLQNASSADIAAGELIVQIDSRLRLFGPWAIKLIQQRVSPICPHLGCYRQDQTLWQTIDCRRSHANNLPYARYLGACETPYDTRNRAEPRRRNTTK